MTLIDVAWCRAQFPALQNDAVFFDGPAGSQVPRQVIQAVADYFTHHNANHGGVFATSVASDQILEQAHHAVADLVGCDDPACIVFGPNMTTLTFALSRALARTWRAGDEILVSRLDHDANVTPWALAARDAGATLRHIDLRYEDCTLDMEDFCAKLSPRTRLVAVACASNAVGSINPVSEICRRAHEAGSLVFLDAVHFAPHARMRATEWDCDFLACSAYKFFGPHVGVLYGKRRLLEELPAYKVRPAPDEIPGRWMTGTQNHEGIAGTLAAVEYLTQLAAPPGQPQPPDRRMALEASYDAIAAYERQLTEHLLNVLENLNGVTIWGIRDRTRLGQRVPTISFTLRGATPLQVARYLARHGVFVWAGNHYAQPLIEALGLEDGGTVRVGLLHYNTVAEIDRLGQLLEKLDRGQVGSGLFSADRK